MASGIHYISFISPEQNTSGIKEEKHYEKQTDRTSYNKRSEKWNSYARAD